jgi:hypothetical protein
MKLINITVPSTGNITPFELHRAIANREEYLKGMSIPIPKINKQLTKLEIKPSVGLWNFITGCLP